MTERDYHHRILTLNHEKWFSFEPYVSALYRAILRPGSVAVDGGANIGVHTLQMAQAVNPDGVVLAIEPVPELLARIETRRQECGVVPACLIRPICCGLSNLSGQAEFHQVLDPIQHELSGLRKRHFLDNMEVRQIRVELRTLDDLCSGLSRLDFMKLDLEGAEFDALRGGCDTLNRFRPVITLEQDQYSPAYFGYTWASLLGFFTTMHYRLYDLFGFPYTRAEMLNLCAVWDFVAVPNERAEINDLFLSVRQAMVRDGVIDTLEL